MPDSWVALAIALLAVVPGYIATTVWSRARTWKGPAGDLRTILQSLALSGAIQVVISPLTIWWIVPVRTTLGSDDHPVRVAIWFGLAVLVLPIGLGLAIARCSDWLFRPIRASSDLAELKWFRRSVAVVLKGTPMPGAWDWLFMDNRPNSQYVLVEFEDGSRVGGVFGDGGHAFTTPETQGLFLPEEWVLDEDGDFQEPVPRSAGILIPTSDKVRWIRILDSELTDKSGTSAVMESGDNE
jgi:hypothetical protein